MICKNLIFISIKIEGETFVVLNDANRERFALRMHTRFNLQIIKTQCQPIPLSDLLLSACLWSTSNTVN